MKTTRNLILLGLAAVGAYVVWTSMKRPPATVQAEPPLSPQAAAAVAGLMMTGQLSRQQAIEALGAAGIR